MIAEHRLPQLTCQKCGYNWVPRVSIYPRLCPKCKTHYWQKQKNKGKERKNG